MHLSFGLTLSSSLYHKWSTRWDFNQAEKGHKHDQKRLQKTILIINMKNTMKSTRRMRELPFSYSNPRNDPTTNIEPNTASDLFCHALHSMYACITIKPTPELLILVSTAIFLLIERFFKIGRASCRERV